MEGLASILCHALSHLALTMARVREDAKATTVSTPSEVNVNGDITTVDPLNRFYEMATECFTTAATLPVILTSLSDEAMVALADQLDKESTTLKFDYLRMVALVLGCCRQSQRPSPLPVGAALCGCC